MPLDTFKTRMADNVAGKFYVGDQCLDCDLCREVAPANFARNDEGGYSYVKKQPETPEELSACHEAREGCCTETIYADGDNFNWTAIPAPTPYYLTPEGRAKWPRQETQNDCCKHKKNDTPFLDKPPAQDKNPLLGFAAWCSLVAPFAAAGFWFLVLLLFGPYDRFHPQPFPNTDQAEDIALCVCAISLGLGIASLSEIGSLGAKSILWKTIPGIIASCFFGVCALILIAMRACRQ